MVEPTVTTIDAGEHKVACRATVPASASEIFALVADPHRHPELDGSGTVRERDVKGPHELTVGAKFGVGMKQLGVPYAITSTVTEIEQDKVVEWQHPLGHRWRWELESLGERSTQVTETFDYTTAKSPKFLELFKMDKQNEAGITATLKRLVERFS